MHNLAGCFKAHFSYCLKKDHTVCNLSTGIFYARWKASLSLPSTKDTRLLGEEEQDNSRLQEEENVIYKERKGNKGRLRSWQENTYQRLLESAMKDSRTQTVQIQIKIMHRINQTYNDLKIQSVNMVVNPICSFWEMFGLVGTDEQRSSRSLHSLWWDGGTSRNQKGSLY